MMQINAALKHRPILAQKLIDYGCLKDHNNKQGLTALDINQKQQASDIKFIKILSDGSKLPSLSIFK